MTCIYPNAHANVEIHVYHVHDTGISKQSSDLTSFHNWRAYSLNFHN